MNYKSEMTVTDIINIYLTKIGLIRTKELMLHGVDEKYHARMESAIDKQFQEGINPKTDTGVVTLIPNVFPVTDRPMKKRL